jgi:hypothetical protein
MYAVVSQAPVDLEPGKIGKAEASVETGDVLSPTETGEMSSQDQGMSGVIDDNRSTGCVDLQGSKCSSLPLLMS